MDTRKFLRGKKESEGVGDRLNPLTGLLDSVVGDNQLVGTLPVIPLEDNQLNLFPEVKPTPALLTEVLVMSADALLKWKAQVLDYWSLD